MKESWKSRLAVSISGLLMVFMVCFPFSVKAEYAHSKIPKELLEDANSVYRVNNWEVTVDGPGSYTITVERVVTILNENGKGADILVIQYDSHTRARFREGAIYDKDGKQISKIKNRDLIDTSMFQDFSLYEDTRVLAYEPKISSYPYTVRYLYEVKSTRGLYYATPFRPHGGYSRSLEQANLIIDYPASMNILYREANIDQKVESTEIDSKQLRLHWHFENLPAIRHESLTPGFAHVGPEVLYATEEFEFAGYQGKSSSWKEFGLWQWRMNQGRDKLPRERVDQLKDLVKDIESEKDKVKAVYEFLQSRTRYVNIALGIGGLQPFDAETVDQTGYGDCKALTNYMMAMLKAIDVESHYTLVKSGVGNYSFYEEFSVFQFNHAILCVPLENDTIWLECTSQITPFGHLGDFTDDRSVLVIRNDGGHLVRTYGYTPDQNRYSTYAVVQIDESGDGRCDIEMKRGGIYFVDYRRPMRMSDDEQQKWLYRAFPFPNYTIQSHTVFADLQDSPVANIEMNIQLRSFANMSGKRMFIPLNALLDGKSVPKRVRDRMNPFEIKFPTVYADTLVFHLPEGYLPENVIPDYSLESEFGKYTATIVVEDNVVTYVRNLEVFAGFFEPEVYKDYFRFYQNVARADSQSIIFAKE